MAQESLLNLINRLESVAVRLETFATKPALSKFKNHLKKNE